MGRSSLSLASAIEALIRRKFTSAGLTFQTLSIDCDTIIEFWGPPSSPENQEKPVLLLLHGFGPTAMWQWHRQAKILSPFFRLYVPNLLFFGGSMTSTAGDGDRWSEVFQAVCMARLMEKLGVERFSVAGTSYGGFVAYHMASMWPEKVEKVVLASSGLNTRRSDGKAFLETAKCDSVADLMIPSKASDLRRLFRMVSSRTLRYVPDFILNDFCRRMYHNRDEKVQLLNGLSLGRDDTINLPRLRQEVLLIWGAEDKLFPLAMAHDLQEILGEKARLEVIQKASHLPQLEKFEEFNDILMCFLCTSTRLSLCN